MTDPHLETDDPAQMPAETSAETAVAPLDLDRIERDLASVELALARLDSGDYWNDEITGRPLDEALLEADPLARRAP